MSVLQDYFEQERGRRIALATGLGVTAGAVSQWDRVPAERVLDVERLTGISAMTCAPICIPGGRMTAFITLPSGKVVAISAGSIPASVDSAGREVPQEEARRIAGLIGADPDELCPVSVPA